VAGVVDLPAADSMFQAVGAPPGVSLAARLQATGKYSARRRLRAVPRRSFARPGARSCSSVRRRYCPRQEPGGQTRWRGDRGRQPRSSA
jgi:hypothetical protein